MRYLLLLSLLAFGCESENTDSENTDNSSDCRMADSECANGFSCQMSSDGAYECLPIGEEPTGGECIGESSTQCFDNDVYWVNSCGNRGEIESSCSNGESCVDDGTPACECISESSTE